MEIISRAHSPKKKSILNSFKKQQLLVVFRTTLSVSHIVVEEVWSTLLYHNVSI